MNTFIRTKQHEKKKKKRAALKTAIHSLTYMYIKRTGTSNQQLNTAA